LPTVEWIGEAKAKVGSCWVPAVYFESIFGIKGELNPDVGGTPCAGIEGATMNVGTGTDGAKFTSGDI